MYYIRQLPRYKLFGYGIFQKEIIERIEVQGGLVSHLSNAKEMILSALRNTPSCAA